MLCFLLQGLPAAETMNAVMAYMLADWYRPGVMLDFPKGGSGAIADALARGVVKYPTSKVFVNAHVNTLAKKSVSQAPSHGSFSNNSSIT